MGLSSSKLSDSRIKLQPEQILSLAQSHKQNMYELHEKISKQFEDLHTSRFSILENIQTAKIVEWKKFSRDRLTKADNLLRRIYILYQNFLRFKNHQIVY